MSNDPTKIKSVTGLRSGNGMDNFSGPDADWATPGDCMPCADAEVAKLANARADGRMTFASKEEIREYCASGFTSVEEWRAAKERRKSSGSYRAAIQLSAMWP